MTDRICLVCGATMDVEWIDVRSHGESMPTYLPGQVECPNHCDPAIAALLTRDDGPVFNAAGQCVSLGLDQEIRDITGDRHATLRSVINDPDVERRRVLLYRIKDTAARIGILRTPAGAG